MQEKNLRIAIQGDKGSNHHLLANKLFEGKKFELVSAKNFKEEAQILTDGGANLALMAIENSIAGTILGNFDILSNNKFMVVGEGYLRIEHCLISTPGTKLEQISQVFSQEIALHQCQAFIDKQKLDAHEYFDTAASVPHALELNESGDSPNNKSAGIAPALAAEIYGGEIIERGIETNKQNYTRFVVLSREEDAGKFTEILPTVTDKNKAMIEFSLAHESGSLVKVLQKLSELNFNLTKIESRPIIGESWNYKFYVDFVTSKLEKEITKSLSELQGLITYLRVLGIFPSSRSQN